MGHLEPTAYEAEATNGKNHSGLTMPWDDCWRRELPPQASPRYASAFRLEPGLSVYKRIHMALNDRGQWRHSCEKWTRAIPGVVAVDIDSRDLGESLSRLRLVLVRLREAGVADASHCVFYSGSKGFHVQFLPEAFGDGLLAVNGDDMPSHERAVHLALQAVCGDGMFDPAMRQTLRLLRTPNSLHENGKRWKTRLTDEEAMSLPVEAILALAAVPRAGWPTVPAAILDPALESLFKAEQVKWLQRPARHHPAQGPAGQAVPEPMPSPLSEPGQRVLLDRIHAALDAGRGWLRAKWFASSGRIDQSRSAGDFCCAKELAVMGWPRDDIVNAILLRPHNCSWKGPDWVTKTVDAAVRSASMLEPNPSVIRQAIEPQDGPDWNWLKASRLWDIHGGLGRQAWEVWTEHVRTCIVKAGKPIPGQWSQEYFVLRSSLNGDGSRNGPRIACSQTCDKALVMFRILGMLKRTAKGTHGHAARHKLRIPLKSEEGLLIRGAKLAMVALRDRSGHFAPTLARQKQARKAFRGLVGISPGSASPLDGAEEGWMVSSQH